MAYYRQPAFYRSFQCIGDKCPYNCCFMWRIDWTKEEVEKVKSANCSPELHELIEKSFVQRIDNENMMEVDLTKGNNYHCPLLTENGLCRIQRELGAEYLSTTCMLYPRLGFFCKSRVSRTCSASCYHVMQTLYNDPNAMDIIHAPLESSEIVIKVIPDTPEKLKEHPELSYRNELFDFFYEIISNKKRTIETSLLLGALAAQKLTEYVERGEQNRIPEIIRSLRPQLNAQTVPSFEKTAPNYSISLGIVGKIVDILEKYNLLENIKDGEQLSVEKYIQGRQVFTDFIEQKPYFMRNLALNLLFETIVPFLYTKKSIFDNYCCFISIFSAIKLVGSAAAYKDKQFNNDLLSVLCFCIREFLYSHDRMLKVYDILESYNITTPSKIALMLK